MPIRNLVAVIVVALAAAFGLVAAQRYFSTPDIAAGPTLQAVRLFSPARTLPAFVLRQSDGTPLVPGELKGHWTLVFLGFTHCPDICPTTLAQLGAAQRAWSDIPDATRPRVLFVSVYPDRDTPDRIGEYVRGFHRDTWAATADIPALERFTRSLSLVFQKHAPEAGAPADAYTVDHSAGMVVLDPLGRMAGVVQAPFEPVAIAADLRALTLAR